MWRFIVPIAFLHCGLSYSIEDLSQLICKNAKSGDTAPNPRDCNSYFVCGTVPLISFCDAGLHFDAKKKVCNWPDMAKCQINETDGVQAHHTPAHPEVAAEIEMFNSAPRPIRELTPKEEKQIPFEPLPNRFHLYFSALDVNTHKPIDPMSNYDPENVACHHYGAYFIPHPIDCSAYYICAFGHMLPHKCGRGTGWNYKRQACEIRPLAECYIGTTLPISNSQMTTASEEATNFSDGQLNDMPPKAGFYTVCYSLANGVAGPITWLPQSTIDASWSQIASTRHPSSSAYTDNQLIRTPPTIAVDSFTGRTNDLGLDVLSCPKESQAYLRHSTDCSKYYICIIGMPVLTSCPEGMYWDQKAEVCDSPTKVDCQQQVSK